MSYKLSTSLVFLVLFSGVSAHATEADYATCARIAVEKPADARALGQKMLKKRDDASARHCLAMASFSLKDYARAGKELDTLRERVKSRGPLLEGQVLEQAGQAWEKAGKSERAVARYTEALRLLDERTEPTRAASLLRQRARLSVRRAPLSALQDLDHAVTLAPNDAEVLLTRAEALLAMGQKELAGQDAEQVLARDPANARARTLRRKTR